jgi:hypothetical protein
VSVGHAALDLCVARLMTCDSACLRGGKRGVRIGILQRQDTDVTPFGCRRSIENRWRDWPGTAADNLYQSWKAYGPAYFETTAWELALTTQSLVCMDSEVAFAVSRVYGVQRRYEGLTKGITHAMYLRPPSEGPETFFPAVAVFYSHTAFLNRNCCECTTKYYR